MWPAGKELLNRSAPSRRLASNWKDGALPMPPNLLKSPTTWQTEQCFRANAGPLSISPAEAIEKCHASQTNQIDTANRVNAAYVSVQLPSSGYWNAYYGLPGSSPIIYRHGPFPYPPRAG
jgi:hypothetical protein